MIFVTDVTMRRPIANDTCASSRMRDMTPSWKARPTSSSRSTTKGASGSRIRRLCRTSGYSDEELIGTEAAELFETKDEFVATWRSAIESPLSTRPRELIAHRKDGSLTHLEASASQWKTGSRLFVTVILRDINQRRATRGAARERNSGA